MNIVSSAAAQWWADGLLRASVQGGMFIVIAWLALRLLPRLPSSIAVWVWRIILVKMLVAVFWPLAVEAPHGTRLPGVGVVIAREASVLPAIIFGLTIVGLLMWMATLLKELHAARNLVRTVHTCTRPAVLAELHRAAQRLRIRNMPELCESPAVVRPMLVTGGLGGPWRTRSVIVVPSQLLDDESPAAIGAVLAHELAHLRRHDLSWAWIASGAGAVFFFHPLVWLALSMLRRAQDEACDSLALRASTATPSDYGKLLLRIARGPKAAPITEPVAAGVVESFRGLRRRLLQLAHPSGPVRIVPLVAILVLCVSAAPTWQLVPGPKPVNWDEALFVKTSDGRDVSIPVIVGDGVGATVMMFGTGRDVASASGETPIRVAAPIDGGDASIVTPQEPRP